MDSKRLRNVLIATATKALGGQAGDDHTSWAEDIAHEAITKLLLKGALGDDDAFKLGIKIVKDLAKDHRRVERNRRTIEREHGAKINNTLTGQSAHNLAADPLEIMAYDEMKERLDELSPLIFATTELHYIQGLDVSAIAEMQGVSEPVIYKRLQRARDYVAGGSDGQAD